MKVSERSLAMFDQDVVDIFSKAVDLAEAHRHEFLTVEHIAYILVRYGDRYTKVFENLGQAKHNRLTVTFKEHLNGLERVPEGIEYELEESINTSAVIEIVTKKFVEERKGDDRINVAMFVAILVQFNPKMCFAARVFHSVIKEDMPSFLIKLLMEGVNVTDKEVGNALGELVKDITSGEKRPSGMRGELRVLKGPAALELLKKELSGKVGINVEESGEQGEWEHGMQVRVDVMFPFGAKNKGHKTYCRDYELDTIVTTLMRKDRSNIILVGEPGVGKSQMGYAIQQLIDGKECPPFLRGTAMFELNLSGLTAGVQMKGEVDARMATAMSPFVSEKAPKVPIIIFIDDIHPFVANSRQAGEVLDVFAVMKPYAELANIHFVLTASYEDYNKLQGSNRVVDTLFHKIEIKEPSKEDTKLIVGKVISSYAKYHNVSYPASIISEAVELAERHIGEQFFPAKVIDLLDEAGAMMRAQRGKEQYLVQDSKLKVSSECLQRVIAIRTHKEKGATNVGKSTSEKYAHLLEEMQKKIYGQDTALNEVVNTVLMGQAGLEDETKPLASLFFVGPTGVGKTEVAKELANQLEVPLIRFDMSEFSEAHTVAKFLGSPAGYIGYEEGGLLTNAVRKAPGAVILFDEIEKAHKDIYNILLQVMDYASLTDSKGVKASFRNNIIIFTSNAGAQFAKQASLGFGSRVTEGDAMLTEVKKVFKPEFINRLSRIVVFNGMDKHMASLILDSRITKLQEQVSRKNVTITFSEAAKEWLLEKGYTPEYGAREMDRVISQYVKSTLSRALLYGALSKKGAKAVVDVVDGELKIS